MELKIKSRIPNWVRLFIFFTLLSMGSYASEAMTVEGRVNRNAFPRARFGEKYSVLPKGVETELRSRIEEVLGPIRLAPAAWFRASLGMAPPAGDRRKILESYAETEIWKCQGGSCSGCPGNENSGCVLGNKVAGGIGVVALIHPCLYGEGKCPEGTSTNTNAWVEKFVLGVAYYKAGRPKNNSDFRRSLKASGDWLKNTSHSVNLLLGACPGPYSADSMKFLFELEAISLPNPAILRCGQAYLETLRTLPAKCSILSGEAKGEWSAYSAKFLRTAPDILRCDPYCMKMLCRPRETGTVFALFSGKPALLIGDSACEGDTPKRTGNFLRDAIPRSVRAKVEAQKCLPTPVADESNRIEDGEEVQLID